MKSLMISSDFPPVTGGQSRFLFDLWSNLPPDEIIVLAPKIKNWKIIDNILPFKVIRLNLPLQKGLFIKIIKTLILLLYTIKIILFKKIDRIHCGQVLSAGFVGYICHLLFRIPYFPYVHGADFLENVIARRSRSNLIKKTILNLILKNASLIIANSSFTKNALIGFGISGEKIIVINPPVDYKRFKKLGNSEELKENYGLKDKRFYSLLGDWLRGKGTIM